MNEAFAKRMREKQERNTRREEAFMVGFGSITAIFIIMCFMAVMA